MNEKKVVHASSDPTKKSRVSTCSGCHVGFEVRSAHCRNFQGRREYTVCVVILLPHKIPPTTPKLPKWHHEAPIHFEFPLFSADGHPKSPGHPKQKPTVSFYSIIPIYQQLSLKAVIKTVLPQLSEVNSYYQFRPQNRSPNEFQL